MRHLGFRFSGIVLVGFLAAGCAGAQGQAPGAASAYDPNILPSISRTTSPCAITGYFYFHGACLKQKLPAAGATFKLATYKGLTLSLAFPKNTGRGVEITVGDATGKGDVTGQVNGKNFSAYPTPCAKSACPGTGFMYYFIESAVDIKRFTGPTTLTITNTGTYPGKTCYFAFYMFSATPPGWWPIGSYSGVPSGHNLTISINFGGLSAGSESNTFALLCV